MLYLIGPGNSTVSVQNVSSGTWEFVPGTGAPAGPVVNTSSTALGNGDYTAMLQTVASANRRRFTLAFTLAGLPDAGLGVYTFMVTNISLEEMSA